MDSMIDGQKEMYRLMDESPSTHPPPPKSEVWVEFKQHQAKCVLISLSQQILNSSSVALIDSLKDQSGLPSVPRV